MAESHAYGSSLGCVSRRLFVLAASSVMAMLCFIQIMKWTISFHLWDAIMGNTWEVKHENCTGTQCYEVLTCFGMKDATAHVREPLATLAGALLLPFGVTGAQHCYRAHLRVAGGFLLASAALHAAILAADVAYLRACGAYPANVVDHTLTNWLPPSPVTNGAQAKLRSMASYPVDEVALATDGFQVMRWYLAVVGSMVVFLAYVAREALLLGDIAERGPIGLGMHFGLGQWDEVLNHDAIRRHKEKGMRSQFVEDARLPMPGTDLEAAPFGYMAPGCGYGAAGAVAYLPRAEGEDEEAEAEAAAMRAETDAALAAAEAAAAAAAAEEDAAAAAAAAAAAEEEERGGFGFL